MIDNGPSMDPSQAAGTGPGPSPRRLEDRQVGLAGRVWGGVLLIVGLWLFATITLRLDLPAIPVGEIWPLALIAIGGVLLLGSSRRGR